MYLGGPDFLFLGEPTVRRFLCFKVLEEGSTKNKSKGIRPLLYLFVFSQWSFFFWENEEKTCRLVIRESLENFVYFGSDAGETVSYSCDLCLVLGETGGDACWRDSMVLFFYYLFAE